MKVGLGLYRHMLTRDYYDFARQAGATHVVVHLVDYFNRGKANPRDNQPSGEKYEPWGIAGDPEKLWTVAELKQFRGEIEDAGLVLAAIENIDPAHWHDILLDGPLRSEHIENVKTIIRRTWLQLQPRGRMRARDHAFGSRQCACAWHGWPRRRSART
jgi:mannonate dehydratase